MTQLNILVTSASKKVPLIREAISAARRITSNYQIIAGDVNHNVLTRFFADHFLPTPQPTALHLDAWLSLCLDNNITTILPTRDGELQFFADNIKAFQNVNTNIIISPPNSIRNCLDKLSFYESCSKWGIAAIPTYRDITLQHHDCWVVKERFGAGSRNIGIKLSSALACEHAKSLNNPIFQPYINGQEISVDAWIDNQHAVKSLVLRTRDLILNGESQVTTTFRNIEIENYCMRMFESLRLRGPIVAQLIRTPSGEHLLMECNPRFGGASTAAIHAGVDSLYWSFLEACGTPPPPAPPLRIVKQVRYPQDLHIYDSDI